ncbi:ATP-binding protein [Desulfogranum japonicum]|uniref:ATP-binding protein n=1 Tax=Desulfogranum japonicum TaxID=231447 RepID=UPI0004029D06|nr:ATP-binding protein [Desulfogranum japonicum]
MKTHFLLNSSPETFEKLRCQCEELADIWNISLKIVCKIVLIAEELYTNAIKYSSADNVEITLEKKDAEIIIEYKDSGPPFNPLRVTPPDLNLPFEKRCAGGLGLHLVRHLTESSIYSREGSKNILRLTLRTSKCSQERRSGLKK